MFHPYVTRTNGVNASPQAPTGGFDDFLRQMMVAFNTRPAGNNASEFTSQNSPTFGGLSSEGDVDKWVKDIERIFDLINCDEQLGVLIGTAPPGTIPHRGRRRAGGHTDRCRCGIGVGAAGRGGIGVVGRWNLELDLEAGATEITIPSALLPIEETVLIENPSSPQ